MPSLGSIPCQTLTTHARASLDLNFESVKKLTQLWILNWRNLPTLRVTTDHGPVESEKVRDRSDQGGIEWSSEGSRSLAGSILLGPPPPCPDSTANTFLWGQNFLWWAHSDEELCSVREESKKWETRLRRQKCGCVLRNGFECKFTCEFCWRPTL